MTKKVIVICLTMAVIIIVGIYNFAARNTCLAVFNLTIFTEQFAGFCARYEEKIFPAKSLIKTTVPTANANAVKPNGIFKAIPGPPSMLAWANNTNAQWDLYLRSYDGAINRLTNTPEDESFPRISPDGKWLFFIRRSGQSSYLGRIDIASLREDSFHMDSVEYISFVDERTAIIDPVDKGDNRRVVKRMDIETGQLSDDPVSNHPRYKSMNLHQPAYSKGANAMYVLVNKVGWRIEWINLVNGETKEIGSGCRPSTAIGADMMVMTSNRGNGQSSIIAHDFKSGEVRTIVDMPGNMSHEYDGTLSSDGKWLLFTVSPNDQTIAEKGANYMLYACPINDCSNPEMILDMPGADSFPYLYVKP